MRPLGSINFAPTTTNAPQQDQDVLWVSASVEPTAEAHTEYLRKLGVFEKAFKLAVTIKVGDKEHVLDKYMTQADQGSDMNVISMSLARFLDLELRPLRDIGFQGLAMKTADHRQTVLHYWVNLTLVVEGIERTIRCFVGPEILPVDGRPAKQTLLLGLPWLYSVNAYISIRESRIQVGDPAVGETICDIQGPELVYCKDHNLLMYPKHIAPAQMMATPETSSNVEEIESSSSSSSGEELSEVEDPNEEDF